MTRVSFSGNAVNVELPKGWFELTQQELVIVISCLDIYHGKDEDPRLFIFLKLTGITVQRGVKPDEKGRYKCIVPIKGGPSRVVWLSPGQFLSIYSELDWVFEPGDVPVRIERYKGGSAINAKWRGLAFEDYLKVENLYQAFLATQDAAHVRQMERILYPGFNSDTDYWLGGRTINMLNWVTQVKAMFARMFPNLFKPVSEASEGAAPNMVEIMNNQIRILTGGDVTKEKEVLHSDCWRALTELDYKARESEELRKLQQKK